MLGADGLAGVTGARGVCKFAPFLEEGTARPDCGGVGVLLITAALGSIITFRTSLGFSACPMRLRGSNSADPVFRTRLRPPRLLLLLIEC